MFEIFFDFKFLLKTESQFYQSQKFQSNRNQQFKFQATFTKGLKMLSTKSFYLIIILFLKLK